jgi:hypothetical protein
VSTKRTVARAELEHVEVGIAPFCSTRPDTATVRTSKTSPARSPATTKFSSIT